MWWIADNDAEAVEMKADLEAKGCKIVKDKKEDESERHHIIFSLPKAKANEMLGYQVEEEEWLVDWKEEDSLPLKPSLPSYPSF